MYTCIVNEKIATIARCRFYPVDGQYLVIPLHAGFKYSRDSNIKVGHSLETIYLKILPFKLEGFEENILQVPWQDEAKLSRAVGVEMVGDIINGSGRR